MKNIIKEVALRNGVSEEHVRKEMEKSINEAFLKKSPAFVKAFGDREPSPEEFIEKMTSQLRGLL